jgi:hypothetical protein
MASNPTRTTSSGYNYFSRFIQFIIHNHPLSSLDVSTLFSSYDTNHASRLVTAVSLRIDSNCSCSYNDLPLVLYKLMDCLVFNSNQSVCLASDARYIYGAAEISNLNRKQV